MIVRILAIDDDEAVLDIITGCFAKMKDYRVARAETARKGIDAVFASMPDLVFLDWKLPDRTGQEVCQILRRDERTAALPIIMLTSMSQTRNKVDALEMGADDYVTKPFEILELRARAAAVLRRRLPWLVQMQPIHSKEVKLDPATFRGYVNDKDVDLTKVEFQILYLLMANEGRIVSRGYIENRALDLDAEAGHQSRALDVHLSHIRSKLGQKAGTRIETVRDLGYIFGGEKI